MTKCQITCKSLQKSSKCQNFLRVWHLVIFRADQSKTTLYFPMNDFPFSVVPLWLLWPTTFSITALYLLQTKIQWQHCPVPKVAYYEPLRVEQHFTYIIHTSVSCELSNPTTPLSVVRVCLVNTVFTAGSVPHYMTFDFALSTFFTQSFNSRCFRRQPCRLWVDSANPWAGKQEGRIPCWRSESKVFPFFRHCVTPPMLLSSTWLLLSQPND